MKKHSVMMALGAYLVLTAVINTLSGDSSVIWDCVYYTVEYGILCLMLFIGLKKSSKVESLFRLGVVAYKVVLLGSVVIAACISKGDYDVFRDNLISNAMSFPPTAAITILFFTILKLNKT